MVKKVVVGVVVVVAIILGYRYYTNWQSQKAVADGEVSGLSASDPKSTVSSTPSTDSGSTTPSLSAVSTSSSDPAQAKQPDPAPQAAPAKVPVQAASLPPAPASAPANDTLSPNAPSGMAFGGKGVYQWYRQGNLTWRINTQTGKSCVIYATMEEWRKDIVMRNGCGHSV